MFSNNHKLILLFLPIFLPTVRLSAVSSDNMASTVTPIVPSSSAPFAAMPSLSSGTPEQSAAGEHHPVLLAIHSVVLLSGAVSLSLMMYMMKSNVTSSTSIAVLNLIVTHFVYLLTVPFRIYYHANEHWTIGIAWCRMISAMIHVHMYMSFIFYVIILVSRLIRFYCRPERKLSFNRGHAILLSMVVWVLVLLVFPCVWYFYYGKMESSPQNAAQCFRFGKHIVSASKVLNYIVSIGIILVSSVLTALQAKAVHVLYRKHQRSCTFQQDFGAQLKSLFFAAIMMVCFVPYHVFRLIYLGHLDLERVNEVFLSLTTFSCLDMITFLGNTRCYMCLLGKRI